jgi:arylsulfatase A-like enzyme/tetratricopeptide (TPR) repeat protein
MLKKAAALLIVLAAATAAWWFTRTPAFAVGVSADQNVLLVTIDTLRADALSAYGGKARTPNIDRLAAHGARFDFAHAHAVVTLVSHASILSGRYPYDHGIRDNTGYRFPQSMPTAATVLKTQGFATGAFVGGFPLDHRFGLNVGFDVYDDNLAPPTGVGAEAGERERRADAVVSSAVKWIGDQKGKWFSWVHVYDPHVTYSPPQEFLAQYPNEPYYGEVAWTDFALGRLFDQLSALPRKTLVIVTADHGEGLGDHGELTHSLFAYESTLHVPLIVAELGGAQTAAPRGVVIETPVRHVDLLPTILDAVGAPRGAITGPSRMPGTSLIPLIAAGSGDDRPSYFEAMSANLARGWAPLRGVLVGREKFIDLPIAELYDLKDDSKELRNVFPIRTDRGNVLINTLKSFNDAPPGRPQTETVEVKESLRALGYIGGGAAAPKEKYTEADDPKRLIELEQTMAEAMTAFRQGRNDDAIRGYRSVIDRRPDTEDAYRKLALVYWRTNQPQLAIAVLEAALRNGVTQDEVKIRLGEYLARSGQTARAIQLLSSFAGDDPDALIALGNTYQLAGRTADAVKTFERLAKVDPKNGIAYENIGIARLESRDFAAAEAALRKAIDVDASLGGAYTALGVVLARTNRRAEAIDAWKQAVAMDAGDFSAMYNLILNLVESGRGQEAAPYADRFIATAPPELSADVAQVRRLVGR